MPVDRGAGNNTRQRRALQRLNVDTDEDITSGSLFGASGSSSNSSQKKAGEGLMKELSTFFAGPITRRYDDTAIKSRSWMGF